MKWGKDQCPAVGERSQREAPRHQITNDGRHELSYPREESECTQYAVNKEAGDL